MLGLITTTQLRQRQAEFPNFELVLLHVIGTSYHCSSDCAIRATNFDTIPQYVTLDFEAFVTIACPKIRQKYNCCLLYTSPSPRD